ncbi:hypothetical protein B0J18DRAFT_423049 [Chaetomium sp. MPI-SDFR-AT-0129]|nr:hypothetical protein B0J18DRAFT_423049 [Chaetomium sp. MPI-SDFR-AT-0129]
MNPFHLTTYTRVMLLPVLYFLSHPFCLHCPSLLLKVIDIRIISIDSHHPTLITPYHGVSIPDQVNGRLTIYPVERGRPGKAEYDIAGCLPSYITAYYVLYHSLHRMTGINGSNDVHTYIHA